MTDTETEQFELQQRNRLGTGKNQVRKALCLWSKTTSSHIDLIDKLDIFLPGKM